MRTLKLYFYGLLVLIFAIFILQNYSTLTYSVALRLNLGFVSLVSIPLPLFLAVPLFFFCGLFLGSIIGWGERRRLSKEIKQLKSTRPEIKSEAQLAAEREERIRNGEVVPTSSPVILSAERVASPGRRPLTPIQPTPGAIEADILIVNDTALTVSEVLYPLRSYLAQLRGSRTRAAYAPQCA